MQSERRSCLSQSIHVKQDEADSVL